MRTSERGLCDSRLQNVSYRTSRETVLLDADSAPGRVRAALMFCWDAKRCVGVSDPVLNYFYFAEAAVGAYEGERFRAVPAQLHILSDAENITLRGIRSIPHCTLENIDGTISNSQRLKMSDYQNEDWVTVYRSAIVELEHAKMSGRIDAARNAIVSRILKLHDMPGLHTEERRAIADALSGLRVLQEEEERYNEDQKRHALEGALEKLRYIAPAILKNQGETESQD
jgi:hypothetical protein